MSDLQILTGISILISGYVQLRCGLSCYHWQVLVQLAWFSSLTHLSCLTFLRSYLYDRPGERAWRLAAMAILLIMLLVAMAPTGNYDWQDYVHGESLPTPTPSDYAICYLHRSKYADNETFASMILSILLLGLGFASRVIRLHRSLSINIERLRRAASGWSRNKLLRAYEKLKVESSPKSLSRTMIYRPLLAIFLALRVGLDAWSSMFVEVWWLFASFLWGVINLVSTLMLSNGGNSDWTFGQVVPIVLLMAPLIAVSEYLYPSKHDRAFRMV
jgi:hypothetical protein